MLRSKHILVRAVVLGIAITALVSPSTAQTLGLPAVTDERSPSDAVQWLAERLYPDEDSSSDPSMSIMAHDEQVTSSPERRPAGATESVFQDEGYAALNPNSHSAVWFGGPNWHSAPLWNGHCRHTRVYRSAFFGRLWFNAEILGWATKRQNLSAQVTSSPLNTAPADAGVLGLGSTTVLFGDESIHRDIRLGGRLTAGWWWDVDQYNGVELHYFGVDGEDDDFRAVGTGANIIARPYTDVGTGLPASALVAYPGIADGSIRVRADMEFSGAGAVWRQILWGGHHSRLDLVAGYRYLRLYDQLRTEQTLTSLDPASGFAAGLNVDRLDRFRTENEFHGGELGLIGRWHKHRWSLEMLGKVALGSSHRGLLIDGQTTTVDAGNNVTNYPGGLLAQPSALGSYTDSKTTYAAEVGASLQYQLTCQCRIYAGYTFIYWADVARNADQVGLPIDPAQIPPAGGAGTAPAFPFEDVDFWAQGLTAGLTYQF